jgi:hypothetical protein
MEIVKVKEISSEFRINRRKPNDVVGLLKTLKPGEALVISAKEADRWKYPAHSIRTNIANAYKKKILNKSIQYSVNTLKSGSYAIVRISN